MHASPFQLLELPDGRWCVAKLTSAAAEIAGRDPVGFYATRDEAELAIDRAAPSSRDPLSLFAAWLRQG